MVKVIETNITFWDKDEISDHQSRIIEVNSWEEFVDEIKEGKSVDRKGTLWGLSLPRLCKIENFKSDDKHLSCDVIYSNDFKRKKLAYLVG